LQANVHCAECFALSATARCTQCDSAARSVACDEASWSLGSRSRPFCGASRASFSLSLASGGGTRNHDDSSSHPGRPSAQAWRWQDIGCSRSTRGSCPARPTAGKVLTIEFKSARNKTAGAAHCIVWLTGPCCRFARRYDGILRRCGTATGASFPGPHRILHVRSN
jgi:hypothetical protein